MNAECKEQFNIPTTLIDDEYSYRKRLQESTEPLKYQMDLRPPAMCYMPGQTFQGLQISQRHAPPSLIDVETYLKNAPLVNEDRDNVFLGDLNNTKPPSMPKLLSNRLIIPDCRDILTSRRNKIRKTDMPQFGTRMDMITEDQKRPMFMLPGIDTRLESRDRFKKKEIAFFIFYNIENIV